MGSSAAAAASSSSCLFSLCFFFFLVFTSPVLSAPITSGSIPPNFTATHQRFVENSGAFLASQNNTFQARITSSKPGLASYDEASFYFVVLHVYSNAIVWSANRNQPISRSSQLRFTGDGLTLYNDTGDPIWSTPQNISSLSSLRLLESGNLVLLDANNNTVWQSFDSPTDVLLEGQKLRVGKSLVSSANDTDLSEGSYRFVIGEEDAMLQWNGEKYWMLSMDIGIRDNYLPVGYLVMNFSGLYLVSNNVEQVVMKAALHNSNDVSAQSSSFRMAKLASNGLFTVVSINLKDRSEKQNFIAPNDRCKIPLQCGKLGLCTDGGSCQCAPAFHSDPKTKNGDCVPSDGSLALPGPCNGSTTDGANIKYLTLRNDLEYFSNTFTDPVARGMNLSACQNLCSGNCSCLGVFYSKDSGSCYMIRNRIGSFASPSSTMDRVGYVKTIAVGTTPDANLEKKKFNFPLLAVVLFPSSGVVAIALVVTLVWFRRRRLKNSKTLIGKHILAAEEEIDAITFPDLPVRFTYQELAVATEEFRTEIGSGGFGTVYKGSLPDGIEVAVKKITSSGAQGKREFLSEAAAIGKIQHVNLVHLKGFCVCSGQKFLVYEYMNQGSLDRNLFQGEPVMGWDHRYKIALGTATGLEYLHTFCNHKIVHCDVKPENILLHGGSQVKVSDFGLSKLLTRDQSGFFTLMRGTRGYIAPEWLTNTAISEKSDVYSYGMVLLEIVSGKRNFFSSQEEYEHQQVNFPLLALEMHLEGRYLELIDCRLTGRVPIEEVEKLVRVALCCLHSDPNLRPSMSDVVRMLEGGKALGEPRIELLNFLRFYDSGAIVENNMQNEVVLQRQEVSCMDIPQISFSYTSSQQVSGPR